MMISVVEVEASDHSSKWFRATCRLLGVLLVANGNTEIEARNRLNTIINEFLLESTICKRS